MALYSPPFLSPLLTAIEGGLCGLGFICCLMTARQVAFRLPKDPKIASIKSIQPLIQLWVGQLFLLTVSVFFFYTLEAQSKLNPRLHLLEPGYFLNILKASPLQLGLQPWLLAGILGVGLRYFSAVLKRKPILSRALAGVSRSPKGYFFNNVIILSYDAITLVPFVVLTSWAIIELADGLGQLIALPPAFSTSMRSTFILALIMVIYRKPLFRFMEWVEKTQYSIGKALLIYSVLFAGLFLFLSASAHVFSLGTEHSAPEVLKSPLAGAFLPAVLEAKGTLLIGGWWCIWIVWLSALVEKAASGFSPLKALFNAMIIPGIFMGWVSYFIDPSVITRMVAQRPYTLLGMLFLFMGLYWTPLYSLEDVRRGAFLGGRRQGATTQRWLMALNVWLGCYLLSWCMLGWLPLQIMVTVGGLFMLLVAASFIGVWGTSLFRLQAAAKYKAQALPSSEKPF